MSDWTFVKNRRGLRRWLRQTLDVLCDDATAQIANEAKNVRVLIRSQRFDVLGLTSATADAEVAWSLVRQRFPRVRFGGCFVCKRISGSYSWSDHAWGDAVDATENTTAGVRNDDVFDWVLRMAKERLLPAELIIGSRNGRVVSAEAPYWNVVAGGDKSHLWHVHISCTRHSGTPPCA